jgi:hypothetical protein
VTLRRCCLFCAVSILGCMSVVGDRGIARRDVWPLKVYLFSATPGRFPAVIYSVKSNKKLEVVREVVPQAEGIYNVVAAEDVIFIIHSDALPSNVQIIHKDDPARVDDVAFDPNGFPIPSVATTAAEPVGTSTELLLPMMDITHLPIKVRLAAVSSSLIQPRERVKFDVWDDYASARFYARAGGPAVIDGLSCYPADDNFACGSYFGKEIVVDALPSAMRGANKPANSVAIAALSKSYVAIFIPPPKGPPATTSGVPKGSREISVHDRTINSWNTIRVEGNASETKLFGSWLALSVKDWNPDDKDSPGRNNERNWRTERLPNVQAWYEESSASLYWSPGVLILQNLADGRKIRIETDQEDSEILWAGQDSVVYRVNDTIFQARIASHRLQDVTVLVKDDDVPEIHWAFWSK